MIELLLAATLLTPGHEPVTICHNNRTITIDRDALRAHLRHGTR